MTRKEALQELKMDAWPGDRLHKFLGDREVIMAYDAYTGSMDAALSLFEAVLPGWYAEVTTEGRVYVSDYSKKLHEVHNDTPSRALLIAILEALAGMEDN